MSGKRRESEDAALQILKSKGFEFNEDYVDNGTAYSISDLQYSDGRYVEVTHTSHNNNYHKSLSSVTKKFINRPLKEINEDLIKVHDALMRMPTMQLTPEGQMLFEQDCRLCEKFYGYSFGNTKLVNRQSKFSQSEFKSIFPCAVYPYTNIIDTLLIKNEKNLRRIQSQSCLDDNVNDNTDLFIFALEPEYKDFMSFIKNRARIDCFSQFKRILLESTFKNVFVCEWGSDFFKDSDVSEDSDVSDYNTDNPSLLRFCKTESDLLKFYNYIKDEELDI